MIIAFANQKGGVGKTTSAINVAASLGVLGKKTLLCDMDPQSNATSGVGCAKRNISISVYDVIIGRNEVKDAVVATSYSNLFVLPADINLAGAEIELAEDPASVRFYRLRAALSKISGEFDAIVIDCPPSLGILTVNALCAADKVVIPMQCEYFALEGLTQLIATLKQIKKLYNPELDIAGILIAMYDGRLNLTVQVMDELKKYFPDKILQPPVPRAVRISEAPSHGMPIYYYDKSSRASDSYMSITSELIALLKL